MDVWLKPFDFLNIFHELKHVAIHKEIIVKSARFKSIYNVKPCTCLNPKSVELLFRNKLHF